MIQLTFHTRAEQAEQLSELLSEAGALAVTLQDNADEPIYEPELDTTPLWSHTQVSALFAAEIDRAALLEKLRGALGQPALQCGVQILEDRDWQRACRDDFQPRRFGARLWVCPSWHTPPDPDAVNLLLDPGLAFGTGMHPTTALCLEWLAAANLRGLDVIDYGCGSGILAVAAAKLGARRVWAADIDPQALEATRANAEKNAVQDVIVTGLPDAELPPQSESANGPSMARGPRLVPIAESANGPSVARGPRLVPIAESATGPSVARGPRLVPIADTLLANILARPLVDLAPRFAALLRPGGHIVLSGLLSEQAQHVACAYTPWFTMADIVVHEGWARLEGIRKSAKV
ncbi:MAG: 50S ribosomal protein L11 methyltransferase [Pseudomonadota bacterium]